MSDLRVLHVIGGLSPGGIQSFLKFLLKKSLDENIECDVCSMSPISGAQQLEYSKISANLFECPIRNNYIRFGIEFTRILRAGNYDVVHVHRSSHVMGIPLFLSKRAKVPIRIAHYQNVAGRSQSLVRKSINLLLRPLVMHSATQIVCVSQAVCKTQFSRLISDKFTIINNPAREIPAKTSNLRAQLGIPSNAFVIGNAARFSEAKNQELILNSICLFGDRSDHCILAGEGPRLTELKRGASRLALMNVHFITWQDPISNLFDAIDVFVFPSLWEGFPLTLVEAQSQRVVCLASNIESNLEALSPSYHKWTYPPGDYERLTELIMSAKRDRSQFVPIIEEALTFSEQFSERNVWSKVRSLWYGS